MDDASVELRRILSANIKRRRKIRGLSQEKLAELAGISANMVNEIEGCRTWVSDKTIVKIARILDTEAGYLLLPSTNDAGRVIRMDDLLTELSVLLHKYKTGNAKNMPT